MPKHVVLQFIKHILIPSVNYGAFIDVEDAKNEYNNIDEQIYTFVSEMMGGIPTIKEVEDLLVSPKTSTGLQMSLPGYFFNMMNPVGHALFHDIPAAYETFHKARERWKTDTSKL